jgi:hypothetical protein
LTNQLLGDFLSLKRGDCLEGEINRKIINSEETVERVSESCFRSPKKSFTHRIFDLVEAKTKIRDLLHNHLRLNAIGGFEEMEQ